MLWIKKANVSEANNQNLLLKKHVHTQLTCTIKCIMKDFFNQHNEEMFIFNAASGCSLQDQMYTERICIISVLILTSVYLFSSLLLLLLQRAL